ncbi:MAG: MFS transporter, partial [Armatimonadetes bacterium]|nr:MFS transporter [Armatimonadota bacterium]
VLAVVFGGVIPFALLLAWPAMVPFTMGALGCAALMGVGNGAVFKLVPQYFPHTTGTVTGLVGAMGGLGGFFPPLLLGRFKQGMGVLWPGFVLLAATAGLMWLVNQLVFMRRQEAQELEWSPQFRRQADQLRAGAWASLVTFLLIAAIVVGSRNLQNFDPALVVYTFAVIFAVWGISYHYYVWLQKPPTRLYWDRGWQLARRVGWLRSFRLLGARAVTHLAAQTFIKERSPLRWWMHQCLFWGCVLAAAITFPLVFGWVHFASAPDDQMTYVSYVFGFPTISFKARSLFGWLLFHGLDFSAVLVLAGISLALLRRMRDEGAKAVQTAERDLFPLVLLFAISVTGLMLTASSLWLRGAFYDFLAITHQITVIAGLLYLPFGKFFHIFQRPAQLGVKLYHHVGDEGEGAACARCGERFASRLHVDDLKERVLPQLGFQYELDGPAGHWQEICPACKRKTLATAQLRLMEESRNAWAPAPSPEEA